ncbi:DUF3043 domain-containing protein [Glaciihabitans sp. dw_435]|uniref:DUF3043 domain-containing protein n=1 Tax=Glaciihabitans sp. dw_435 TaxID=2720081 RepID=UPI001BD37344|nr:DUF3043 domain-containing protein [Glaciihabitans sp. dw_435]
MAKTPTHETDTTSGSASATDIANGKGRPTPTRREKEAARKRPLVSSDRTEARRQSRTAMASQRERARIGMANGEEKFLPIRDRGPQKRFVRDYIDARYSVGELLIPLMLVVIVLTFIPSASVISLIALWTFFALAVIDCFFVGMRVKKKLGEKFGEGNVVSGVRWYAAMRSLQLRAMRLPKPQTKRGNFPA